jgi:hypothetical protein
VILSIAERGKGRAPERCEVSIMHSSRYDASNLKEVENFLRKFDRLKHRCTPELNTH